MFPPHAGSRSSFSTRFSQLFSSFPSPNKFPDSSLGRIHPKKGLEILGAAFEILLKQVPHARLLIAGDGDPSYMATLAQRFSHLSDSGRWIWAGHLQGKDRLAAYAAADVFALTSHSENFGLVVAEAMAAGLPIVLNRELPWQQVEQWSTGLRVENQPPAVAEALLKLATDEGLRAEMGGNGKRRLESAFDWIHVAKEMTRVYEKCLGAGSKELGTGSLELGAGSNGQGVRSQEHGAKG